MKRAQITYEPMPYGRVMVVDDVETNIYVAKGIMAPYGLKFDSADSGLTAIEKIKRGRVYDIVFMDHMMPGMDGIEATKIIREMGYDGYIVALTANAVVGQAEIFMENGFDGFISKPIDIRQMDIVLHEMIREKHPEEAAQVRAELKEAANAAGAVVTDNADPEYAKIFVRDALKAIEALESFNSKGGDYSEEDVNSYVIKVHGIKGALANIGKKELSEYALRLEQAGRAKDFHVIEDETSVFLDSLRKLTKEMMPEEVPGASDEEEDRPYLVERLQALEAACESFDKKTAKGILADLKEKPLTSSTKELLDQISEHLLHSDFDEIAAAVERFVNPE